MSQEEKLNPNRILLDYFFQEAISHDELIKTSAEVKIQGRTYMRHNLPDMEKNVVLKDSVDFIKEALAEIYDLEDVDIVVDQLSVVVNHDTIKAASFIITKEGNEITLNPFLHKGDKETVTTLHKEAIEEFERDLKRADTTKEAIELLRGILAEEYGLALIQGQE